MKTYLDMDEILRHCRANYRYIGKEDDEHYLVSAVPEEVIRSLSPADVVEVVRCCECTYHVDSQYHYCRKWRKNCPDDSDFYCKWGKRKGGGQDDG